MNKKGLFIGLFIILFSSAAFSQSTKEEKEQLMYSHYLAHKQIVASKQYGFVGTIAYLQKGPQVDLNSRPNYLRVSGDNAAADIPYFGRSTNAGYGAGDTGVSFDGEMIDYKVKEVDKKKKVIVSFKVKNRTETYNCTLTLSGKNYATLVVSSSVKQSIRYTGSVMAIKEEQ